MKTSELTGAALDWAVALAEGYTSDIRLNKYKQWEDLGRTQLYDDDYTYWSPSTDWAQGGPIIERENITVRKTWVGGEPRIGQDAWKADIAFHNGVLVAGAWFDYGPTALVAAMRCYVASKLGGEIGIPEELQ